MKQLSQYDVVKLANGKTGVVNRVYGTTVNIFLKGADIGIWYQLNEVKRIGRVVKKAKGA